MAQKLLRILYEPYKWLVLVPVLIVSTSVLALMVFVIMLIFDARVASRVCGVTWARIISYATPIWVKRVGGEHIDPKQSYVIVSNHQSQYDILVLYGWIGIDFKWVMKQELLKAPIIGVACRKLGHIFIDRSNNEAAVRSLNAARSQIRNGMSVVFFPEGTRSRSGRLGAFKKGAFKMATALKLPVLPLTISGTLKIAPPRTLRVFPGKASLTIHPPIDTTGHANDNVTELMAEARKAVASGLNSTTG